MSAKQSFDCRNVHTTPGHLIRRAQEISVAIFMDDGARENVTPVQFAYLSEIASMPGLDATRLASLIAFGRATLGTTLERMEKKGWIARTASPSDRRTKVLIGTAHGDLHDIGSDVPVKTFIDESNDYKPDVVTLSGFLTLAFDSMKKTIKVFEEQGMSTNFKIMIGGGQIDDTVSPCKGWMGVAA